MGILSAVIALAGAALKVWGTKLAQKYRDELTEIETQLRAAINVDYRLRDHALVDDLEFKLQQCLRNIAADLGKPDPVV